MVRGTAIPNHSNALGGINMTIYTKTCTRCKILKPASEFHKKKSSSDGHRTVCKECRKSYYEDNKHLLSILWKQRYEANKQVYLDYQKKYRENNPQKIAGYQKEYYQTNKSTKKEYDREYTAIKRNTDTLYKLKGNISTLIRNGISNNGHRKKSKTAEILGCSIEDFKIHIESQFTEGMTWDNYPQWQLDHITPISWANTEEEIIALNHYTNFQPLWEGDNRKKSNKFAG